MISIISLESGGSTRGGRACTQLLPIDFQRVAVGPPATTLIEQVAREVPLTPSAPRPRLSRRTSHALALAVTGGLDAAEAELDRRGGEERDRHVVVQPGRGHGGAPPG
jgi:hypothetical protein